MKSLESYYAGNYDTFELFNCKHLCHFTTILGDPDFDYPNEDNQEMDNFEYLRGKVNALEYLLKTRFLDS